MTTYQSGNQGKNPSRVAAGKKGGEARKSQAKSASSRSSSQSSRGSSHKR